MREMRAGSVHQEGIIPTMQPPISTAKPVLKLFAIEDLLGAPFNPTRRTEKVYLATLREAILRLGFVAYPPLVSAEGRILDGHRRIAVLRPLAPPANPRNPRRRTRPNAIARMTKRGRQHPVRSHTMITQFIQGSAHSLPQLAAGSVQMIATLFDVFACGVGVAMHPMMAVAAQGDEVVRFGTQGGVACPRFEVMSVEMTSSAASGASVIVSGVDSAEYGLPFSVAIGALAFWGAAVNVIRVQRPTLSILAVSIATQVRLFDLRLNAQNLSSFGRVGFTEKRIHSTRAAHVAIIRCREVLSARARGNAVISQPLVNTFRIAMNNLANVISAKSFVNVLLAQPSFVNRLLCALPVAFALEGTEAARLATA